MSDKIFISCVSSQFKACREALASDIRAIGSEVKVQLRRRASQRG